MALTPQYSSSGSPMPGSAFSSVPSATGLYDPAREKDACGLAMVATLRGTAGHDIIELALDALRNLEHRGAIGSDAGTGDGAGIITQVPDAFLRAVTEFDLPPAGRYAVGMAFLPTNADERAALQDGIAAIAVEEHLRVLGWREVPVDPDQIGTLARDAMPAFQQLFVESTLTSETGTPNAGIALDRQAFRLRKRAERELAAYFPSL
ncbi:MAG: glutamate synthase large chain, partial [Actinomycetota bacterium]|nr:glutamate synthase large chain [Actinomycetota bacterium]